MALTDANPAFGPTEQVIMLEMSEIDRFGAIWIDSDTFENFTFLTLELRELNIRDFEGSRNGAEMSFLDKLSSRASK